MIVKLFDRTELVVSKREAEALAESLGKGTDGYVTLRGMMLKKTAIAYIKPGGTEVDLSDKRIEAPDYRGVYSPAKEKLREIYSRH